MCDHNFQIQTFTEEYYPDHQGEWGGVQFGHQCCGQCKGQADLGLFRIGDGRCHGACGGKCNVTKKRTVSRAVCSRCGRLGPQ